MPLISDNELFSKARPISQAVMQRFLDFCTIKEIPKKGVIIREGHPADKLYYIIKGSAIVTSEDEEGNEIVVAYLNDGDFIGEIGLFYRSKSRGAQVRARAKCELAEIKYERLDQLFHVELKDVYGDILFMIGSQLSERLLKTTRRVKRLAFMDVSGRIARTLLDMCSEPDAMSHPEGTQIHISRQEIARVAGCSREVAGRVLKQMASEGMISISGMNIVVHHSR